jgi:malate dehydrogenase (oxaloacetate-decarboxylating)
VFPAVGLGVAASGARRITDEMLRAAARALAEQSPAAGGPLLPPLDEIRSVSKELAAAVGTEAQRQGHADETTPEELRARIDRTFWEPAYPS